MWRHKLYYDVICMIVTPRVSILLEFEALACSTGTAWSGSLSLIPVGLFASNLETSKDDRAEVQRCMAYDAIAFVSIEQITNWMTECSEASSRC